MFEQAYESMRGPQLCALWSNSILPPELVEKYLDTYPEKLEYQLTTKVKTLDYIVSGEQRLSNGIILELPEVLDTNILSPRVLDGTPPIMPKGNEVWITTKLANILSLQMGDEFFMENATKIQSMK